MNQTDGGRSTSLSSFSDRFFSEDEVAIRVSRIEATTAKAWRFTDTAGLRQVQKAAEVDRLGLLASAYLKRAA